MTYNWYLVEIDVPITPQPIGNIIVGYLPPWPPYWLPETPSAYQDGYFEIDNGGSTRLSFSDPTCLWAYCHFDTSIKKLGSRSWRIPSYEDQAAFTTIFTPIAGDKLRTWIYADDSDLGKTIRYTFIYGYGDFVNINYVIQKPVSTIEIPPSLLLKVGYTKQLTAICKDDLGNTINCPTLVYNSTDPSIASIDQTGLITPISLGLTQITVSGDSVTSNILTVEVTNRLVNGTFDTDLNGWVVETNGGTIQWDNGKVLLYIPTGGLNPKISQEFIVDQPILLFDYSTSQYPFLYWEIYFEGTKVLNGSVQGWIPTFPLTNVSGTIDIDLRPYVGQLVKLVLYNYRPAGSVNGYLWIDNIRLANTSGLVVTSQPSGASIFIDSVSTGKVTPNTVYVPVGTRLVTLKINGFTDYNETIDVPLPGGLSAIFEGCIYFDVSPAGTNIFLDDQFTNKKSPILILCNAEAQCKQPVGDHTYNLEIAGYTRESGTITLQPGKGTIITKLLNPLTSYNYGDIVFNTTPQGANVYLDSTFYGITPITIPNILTGFHNYSLIISGGSSRYDSYIDAQSGINNISIDLNSYPSGSINFNSIPNGANIYLDSIFIGTTPLLINDILTGLHTYSLITPNFENYTGTVNVIANRITDVNITLIPPEGCLYIESCPTSAKIFFDSVDTGNITPYMVCTTVGNHIYELKYPGYTYTENINLPSRYGINKKVYMIRKTGVPFTDPAKRICTTTDVSQIIYSAPPPYFQGDPIYNDKDALQSNGFPSWIVIDAQGYDTIHLRIALFLNWQGYASGFTGGYVNVYQSNFPGDCTALAPEAELLFSSNIANYQGALYDLYELFTDAFDISKRYIIIETVSRNCYLTGGCDNQPSNIFYIMESLHPECVIISPPAGCIIKRDEGIYSKPVYCYTGEGIFTKKAGQSQR